MIDDYTNLEIVEELKIKGFHTSHDSLKYAYKTWGFQRQSGDPGSAYGCLRGSNQCC